MISGIMKAHKVVYGLFSLDFFEHEDLSFCLFPNASALDMLAIKYITVFYALILMILVIWFINKFGGRCLGKCWRITIVKSSVIHGVSTFLILCYSQCIRISLNLLNSFSLFIRNGSNLTVSRRTWLNGDVVYFCGKHLLYAIPALLCLLTIGMVPLLLLLVYPLLNKALAALQLEESKVVKYTSQIFKISKLKPLLDTFQGCFKDRMRFFAGLYFVYRWIPLIVAVALPYLAE